MGWNSVGFFKRFQSVSLWRRCDSVRYFLCLFIELVYHENWNRAPFTYIIFYSCWSLYEYLYIVSPPLNFIHYFFFVILTVILLLWRLHYKVTFLFLFSVFEYFLNQINFFPVALSKQWTEYMNFFPSGSK